MAEPTPPRQIERFGSPNSPARNATLENQERIPAKSRAFCVPKDRGVIGPQGAAGLMDLRKGPRVAGNGHIEPSKQVDEVVSPHSRTGRVRADCHG